MSSNTAETATATSSSSSHNHRLQPVNYANVIGYLANTLVVFGSTAIAGLPDNGTLSAKYQTLVTPAGYAFAIWGIIFTVQLIWTVAQFFGPANRSHALVLKGVGYSYVMACVAQCAWTITFGLEKISLSLVAMICILIPLVMIVARFSSPPLSESNNNNSIGQYWLLKFPFEIHAAWIMAATLVNVNVVLVACETSAAIQTMAGYLSLLVVVVVSLYYTWRPQPIYVVPCVLAWASQAIAVELSQPKDSIVTRFADTPAVIQNAQFAAHTVAIACLVAMLAKIVYDTIVAKRGGGGGGGNSGGAQYAAL